MGRDLVDRTNQNSGNGFWRTGEEAERRVSPQEGDLVSVELKEGYGLTGEVYWGRYKIGKVGSQEPGQVFGLVRAVNRRDLEVDCFVTGYRNINERPKSDEKVLGFYVPREAIAQCSAANSFRKYRP